MALREGCMLDSKTPQPHPAHRAVPLFWIAAALLWFCGIGIGALGHPSAGLVVRWIALAAFAGLALQKPTLMKSTVLAMFAGVEIGLDAPHVAIELRFLGDLFLRLVRMIVAPLLFAT